MFSRGINKRDQWHEMGLPLLAKYFISHRQQPFHMTGF